MCNVFFDFWDYSYCKKRVHLPYGIGELFSFLLMHVRKNDHEGVKNCVQF